MPKKFRKVPIKRLKPWTQQEINIVYKAFPDQRFFVSRYQGKYTYEEIRRFAQAKSDALHRVEPESNMFSVNLKFENGKWKGATFTKPGDPVKLWQKMDSPGAKDMGDIIAFDIAFSVPKYHQQRIIIN